MEIKVKMPGMVLEYPVSVGSKVHIGDIVCQYEALKLTHAIVSNTNGVIKQLCAPLKKRISAGTTIIIVDEE